MKTYIDVDQLFKCETCFHNRRGGCDTYCDVGESYRPAFSKFTIVDAKPVRHGYWMPQYPEDKNCGLVKCSCCNYEYSDLIECLNYCGNCGAKMDGDKNVKTN